MRLIRPFFAVLLFSCLAGSVQAESIAELVDSYDKLRLGEARTASDFSLTVGHATYRLPGGTISPVFAGERQIGLFVEAAGTFAFETANKDELTGLRYNARKAGLPITATDEKIIVTESFESLLLWGNGLPEVTGVATASPQAAFDAHREHFARNIFDDRPADLFAYHAVDSPQVRLVRAEVRGKKFPFIHHWDEVHTSDETLNVLLKQAWRTHRFKDTIYPVLLSRQSIGRGNRDAPPKRALLTDVDVHLAGTMDEKGTLTVVETIVPQKRAMSAVLFTLNKFLYMETEARDRRYNLRSVTDEQDRRLSFHHSDADQLVVGLAEPAAAGKPFKLKFEIDGNFLYREDKTNFWQLGIEPWFPWLRQWEHAYTFHTVVKLEKPFVSFASGKVVRRGEEGNFNVTETKLDIPVTWVAILGGRYQFSEEERNGVTIRVASFITKNESAYKQLRNIAAAAIDYYPFFLGPFPFNEINIIEKTDALGYGQAPAGIVFITSEAFQPKNRDANEAVSNVNMRFAHEIAHMYWGSAVHRASPEEQWLEEAFAEYSAALFMKASKRSGDYQRAFATWKADAKQVAGDATIPMANRLHDAGDPRGRFMTRTGLIYAKGAYLLAALHQELGDSMFLTFMKSYQKSFRGKTGTTADVIGLLNFLTKSDYGPFFDKYYYGTAMPDVKLK